MSKANRPPGRTTGSSSSKAASLPAATAGGDNDRGRLGACTAGEAPRSMERNVERDGRGCVLTLSLLSSSVYQRDSSLGYSNLCFVVGFRRDCFCTNTLNFSFLFFWILLWQWKFKFHVILLAS